ncbi:hypothetical protein BJF85_17135 [Saccharomonospora sp. CUA-673]|nr:hypothetical protein BJF85_17135 [Saccharomonospora sp. CUA-673]
MAGTALACGLAPTAATAAPAPTHTTTAPASAQAISCETEMGSDPFYPGESASEIYDERYSQGAEIPHLDDDFTPQGLGHWADWDGSGTNLLLVTAYQDGADARIHGIEADSGEHVGSVAIAGAHVGGLAVVDDWAFVSGRGSDRIRKYDLDELGDALQAGGTPYLTQVGEAQEVPAASFLGTDGTTLYSGKFNDVDRDVMHAFSVAADGTLTQGTEYECR